MPGGEEGSPGVYAVFTSIAHPVNTERTKETRKL